MQACGLSLVRLLRPVGLVSIAGVGRDVVRLPGRRAGQQPGVPGDRLQRAGLEGRGRGAAARVLRRVPQPGAVRAGRARRRRGWNGVFLSDRRPGRPRPSTWPGTAGWRSTARSGPWRCCSRSGARHTTDPKGAYEVFQFDRLVIGLDPETYFPRQGPQKGVNELTIAELRQQIAELERQGQSPHNELMKIHQKFSIPVACLVFGLIGIALGATNRRDGALGSFALGLVVIFLYYVPMYLGPALTKGGLIAPWLAAWLPNIVLGIVGIAAVPVARTRRPTGRSGFPLPSVSAPAAAGSRGYGSVARRRHGSRAAARPVCGLGLHPRLRPGRGGAGRHLLHLDVPRSVGQGVQGRRHLGHARHLLRVHHAAVRLLHPAAGRAARRAGHGGRADQEQRARRDEGVRHQPVPRRGADARVRGGRRRAALRARGKHPRARQPARRAPAQHHSQRRAQRRAVSTRQWVAGDRGEIYNYTYADPATQALLQVSVFALNDDRSRLESRTFAERAVPGGADTDQWTLEHGLAARLPRPTAAAEQFAAFETRAPAPDAAVRVRDRRARRAVHGLPPAAGLRGSAPRQRARRAGTGGRARAQARRSRS